MKKWKKLRPLLPNQYGEMIRQAALFAAREGDWVCFIDCSPFLHWVEFFICGRDLARLRKIAKMPSQKERVLSLAAWKKNERRTMENQKCLPTDKNTR